MNIAVTGSRTARTEMGAGPNRGTCALARSAFACRPDSHQQIRKFLPKDRQVGARVGYRRPDGAVAECGPAIPDALGSFRIHRDTCGVIGIALRLRGSYRDRDGILLGR